MLQVSEGRCLLMWLKNQHFQQLFASYSSIRGPLSTLVKATLWDKVPGNGGRVEIYLEASYLLEAIC